MNRGVFLASWLGTILAVAAPTLAATKVNPLSLVRQAVAAVNRGDAAASIALTDDNAVMQGPGLCGTAPCVGKPAIQKEIEREVADKVQLKILDKHVSGDTAVTQMEVRGGRFTKAGVDRIIVWATWQVKGGKFVAYNTAPQRTDLQTVKFLEWAQSQPPLK
jgi:hypothetical protein